MRYEVVWGDRAEEMLAEVWLAAADKSAVSTSTNALDKKLSQKPLELGESRESSVHRVAFLPPVGIEFEVIEDDKRVIVQGVFATG